jgi:hypothetical protein
MKLKFRPNHGHSPMVVPPRYLIVQKQAESSLLRKDLSKKEVLLDTGRTRKSDKRIVLKD